MRKARAFYLKCFYDSLICDNLDSKKISGMSIGYKSDIDRYSILFSQKHQKKLGKTLEKPWKNQKLM